MTGQTSTISEEGERWAGGGGGAAEAQNPVGDLSLLNEVSRALLFGMGVEETADYVCGLIVERLGYRIAWIGLATEEESELRPLASRGAEFQALPEMRITPDSGELGREPAGRALRTARAVVIDDVERDLLCAPRHFVRERGCRSAAALPLISGDRIVGVMNVYDSLPGRFDADAITLLQSLANLAASAISVARANEQLKARAADLEAAVSQRTSELRGAVERLEALTATVRARAEEQLRESEARLAIALEAGHMGVWERDFVTGNLTWNNVTEQIFGLAEGTFEGTYEALLARIHADDLPEVVRTHERARREGIGREHEFRILWPDGSAHWIATRGRYEFDESGRPLRASGVVMDIDQRKRAQETARRQQSELAHLLRVNVMSEMASGLAHEINQPLTAISNFAGAALQLESDGRLSGANVREILGDIHQQAHRAAEVIRRLRAFIHKRPGEVAPADLNQTVAEALALMEPELRRAGVRLQITPAPDLRPLSMDAVQIQQVVANLVQNAIDAMDGLPVEHKSLAVSTHLLGAHALVRVSDSGKGIREDDLPRIFDSFYSTKPEGLGMGLNISRSIVESHGGSLVARNNARGGGGCCCFGGGGAGGGGATLEFALPLPDPAHVEHDSTL
jgi:PAS domain S-box-containing protein